jgi:hypothetical protein
MPRKMILIIDMGGQELPEVTSKIKYTPFISGSGGIKLISYD